MNDKTAYPYSVRRQKSGRYTGLHRYIVVRNPGGKRVHECPPSTELAAWRDADRLNVWHLVAGERFKTTAHTLVGRLALAKKHYRIFMPNRGTYGAERRQALETDIVSTQPERAQP